MITENTENSLVALIKQRVLKEKKRPKDLSDTTKRENVKKWCTFYRRNVNLYASRHLQIRLHPFQHIMLYLMGESQVFFAICSRGLSKSFIAALYSFCKCLLYPYSEVHLTATVISQAEKLVRDKMEVELCRKISPVLNYYYSQGLIKFHYDKNKILVEFLMNGSKIWVDVADENARGGRATLLVYEECRLLKKGIIDSVFEKMAHPRQAIFLTLPKYEEDMRWTEECQSIYITSARFTTEWFWDTFKEVVTQCYTNKYIIYNFFAGDMFLAIRFRLKTVSDYFKSKSNNKLEFEIEDLNQMKGEAKDAFFKHEMFKKNQTRKKAYIMPSYNQLAAKEDLKNRQKLEGEIRILWIDLAFATTTGKEENDQSVIGCSSLYKNKDNKYMRLSDYITTYPNGDSDGMDLKIREMYFDYKADYIVIDIRSGGEIIYNNLSKTRDNPYRLEWNNHGFRVCDKQEYQTSKDAKIEDLKNRAIDPQAIPAIIPIVGTPEFNSNMWLDLQKQLVDGNIELLIDDIDFDQQFQDTKGYYGLTDNEKFNIQLPYVMTTSLIHEAINLSPSWNNGLVKCSEPRSGTKDIIVAFGYGNRILSLIQGNLEKEELNIENGDFDASAWSFLGDVCKV